MFWFNGEKNNVRKRVRIGTGFWVLVRTFFVGHPPLLNFWTNGKCTYLWVGLKATVSIVLCTVLLFLSFGKSALVLNYQINKKAIAETRCENRDKPEMHCDGKCYLAKQLKKADEKENPTPDFRNLKELSPYVASETVSTRFFATATVYDIATVYVTDAPVEACPGSVFQPPEA